jgi:eukaryotic-like serine/threonine-protein kinase
VKSRRGSAAPGCTQEKTSAFRHDSDSRPGYATFLAVRGWFGPFRIERQVGRGGLGAVYRAIDSRSGDTVALKLLPPGSDPIALARLEREFGALRALQHPNIVRVLELGEEDGIPWLSMEFVEGLVLRDFLTVVGDPVPLEPEAGYPATEGVDLDVLFDEPDSGALLAAARGRQFCFRTDLDAVLTDIEQEELDRAQRLAALCESLAQICDGLHFIHARGLVHRDLKPSNILVNTAHRAVLVDFGLVKRMQDDRVTDAGRTVGTYRYMSPEQARGEKVDRKADLYSVGATLYELLVGRPPFLQQNQLELLEAIVGQKPADVSQVNPRAPRGLCSLCERLMRKRAEDRPASAAEVASILRVEASNLLRA